MAGIFINYRRDDAPGVAGRLGDRLAKNFAQRQIFMDVDAMKPGLDFVKQLDEQVSKCDVLLAIIGPGWLNAVDEKGRRKLELPRDYVRIELASALKREIPVIPLLVNGAVMPLEEDLPEELKSLPNRHALELRHTRFAADSEAIIKALNGILPRRKRWWRTMAGAGLAVACVLAGIVLWSGQAHHFAPSEIFRTGTSVKLATQETTAVPNSAMPPKPTAAAAAVTASADTGPVALAPMARPARTGDKRVALVIGNSNYQNVPQLPNLVQNANSIGKLFRDAGFDAVDVKLNVDNVELKRAIRKFESLADGADIAVIYYAGHGLEIGGTNYVVPVDAKLASDRDADDETVPLERLVASADGARKLRVIILDASRDNPFVGGMRLQRKAAAASPTIGKVEPTSTNTLIAFAAKAGSSPESDGQSFTTALLRNLTVPGLDIRLSFGRVKDEVMKATNGKQEPFVYGSLGGENLSLAPEEPDTRVDYELVERIGTVSAWQIFLKRYPSGFYADRAREALARLPNQAPKTP
jgi:hypothetical protein